MQSKILEKKIGEVLRELRISAGISQEELASKASVHRTYVGMVERGEKNVTITSLNKLLSALGISFVKFFQKLDES